jgi:microcystin-dependent protein
MATPTFNKYKSTTIYGNLSVRDLTNPAGSSVIEVSSIDLSGNFLSRGDSTFTKKVICNASVGDINANNILTTKQYVDNAISGGGGSSILGLNNTFTGNNTFTNTITCNGTITNDTDLTNKDYVDNSITTSFNNFLAGGHTFTGVNTFDFTTYFNQGIEQNNNIYTSLNKFLNTLFLTGQSTSGILQTSSSGSGTGFCVASGVSSTNTSFISNGNNLITSGTTMTMNAGGGTNTPITFSSNQQVIQSYTLPKNNNNLFYLNVPVSIQTTGTMTLGGGSTNYQIRLANVINSYTAKLYVNGVYNSNISLTINSSNPTSRTTDITYTTSGTKTISLKQYFFNLNFDIKSNDYFQFPLSRDETGTNNITINVELSLTTTLTRIAQTPATTNTCSLTQGIVFNTTTSGQDTTGSTAGITITNVSGGASGTGYSAYSSSWSYNDASEGTTFTNDLRCNTFNLLPAGMVIQYTGTTAPTGWLLCNGATYNATLNPIYQSLYNVIGNQFGGTNNTNFKVPDYRGAFLRGSGSQAGGTTYVSSSLNTSQTHATQTHQHSANHGHTYSHMFEITGLSQAGVGFDVIHSFPTGRPFTSTGLAVDNATFNTGDNNGTINANETRPFNYSVNYLIKY